MPTLDQYLDAQLRQEKWHIPDNLVRADFRWPAKRYLALVEDLKELPKREG